MMNATRILLLTTAFFAFIPLLAQVQFSSTHSKSGYLETAVYATLSGALQTGPDYNSATYDAGRLIAPYVMGADAIFWDDHVFITNTCFDRTYPSLEPFGQGYNSLSGFAQLIQIYEVDGLNTNGTLDIEFSNTDAFVINKASNNNIIYQNNLPSVNPSFLSLEGSLFYLYSNAQYINSGLITRDTSGTDDTSTQTGYTYQGSNVTYTIDNVSSSEDFVMNLKAVAWPNPDGGDAAFTGTVFATFGNINNFISNSSVYFATFDASSVSTSSSPTLSFQALPNQISQYQFLQGSMDAIYITTPAYNGIVLSGTTYDGANLVPKLFFLQWDTDAGNFDVWEYVLNVTTEYQTSNQVIGPSPYGSTQLAWGPLPVEDNSQKMSGNVVTLMFSQINNADSKPYNFLIQLDLVNVTDGAAGTMVPNYLSQSDTHFYGMSQMLNNGLGNIPDAGAETGIDPFTATFFSVPASEGGFGDVSSNTKYFNCLYGFPVLPLAVIPSSSYEVSSFAVYQANPILNTLDSLVLKPSTTDPNNFPTYTTEEIKVSTSNLSAAIESWQLLGVIAGFVPEPSGSSKFITNTVLLESTDESGNDSTSAITSSVSFSASTKLKSLPLSPDFSASTKSSSANSDITGTSYSTDMSLKFSPAAQALSGKPDAQRFQYGKLIVSQPNYKFIQYNVYSADGKTDLEIDYWIYWTFGANIAYYDFFLSDPNQSTITIEDVSINLPIPGPVGIYTFPTDSNGDAVLTWPASNDLLQWLKPIDSNTLLSSTDFALMSTIQAEPGDVTTYGLQSTGKISQSVTNNNTINYGAGVDLFGVSFSKESTWESQSDVTTIFVGQENLSITYGNLDSNGPIESITIQPYLKLANGDGTEPWIPTVFKGQRPWLLTWQVAQVDFTDTSSQNSAFGTILKAYPDSPDSAAQKWFHSDFGAIWQYDINWYYLDDFDAWGWVYLEASSPSDPSTPQEEGLFAWIDGGTDWIFISQNSYPYYYSYDKAAANPDKPKDAWVILPGFKSSQ